MINLPILDWGRGEFYAGNGARSKAAAIRARVGMLGGAHHPIGRAGLDDPAVLHDEDLVRESAHDPQVVADEQVSEAVPGLQFAQELDDLGLHRHVEHRGRLVEHDEPGFRTRARAIAMR